MKARHRRHRDLRLPEVHRQGFGTVAYNVLATLAFSAPAGADTTGDGDAGALLIGGSIVGGFLTWNNLPKHITLGDGSKISVDFEGGIALLEGKSVTTSASVYGRYIKGNGPAPIRCRRRRSCWSATSAAWAASASPAAASAPPPDRPSRLANTLLRQGGSFRAAGLPVGSLEPRLRSKSCGFRMIGSHDGPLLSRRFRSS